MFIASIVVSRTVSLVTIAWAHSAGKLFSDLYLGQSKLWNDNSFKIVSTQSTVAIQVSRSKFNEPNFVGALKLASFLHEEA